jgi:site-specific DNA-methyltransferase (adenine-specific)
MARKPLAGTVAANVLAHGTGAINVDGCRVGVEGGTRKAGLPSFKPGHSLHGSKSGALNGGGCESINAGRWPANVALDEVAAKALDEQTGERPHSFRTSRKREHDGSMFGIGGGEGMGYGDTGGASRFFYTAKPDGVERGEGNVHPTVKPVALMRWLVRMVTPRGGLVLDPFAGSGTTLLAARAEGFRAIGCEQSAEYVEIVRARLRNLEGPLFAASVG